MLLIFIIHRKLGLPNLQLSVLNVALFIHFLTVIPPSFSTICPHSLLPFKQQHCQYSLYRHRDRHCSITTHSSICPSFHMSSQTALCFYVRGQSFRQSVNESGRLNELLISPFRTHTYTLNSQWTVASISPIVSLSVRFSFMELFSQSQPLLVSKAGLKLKVNLICLNSVFLLLCIICYLLHTLLSEYNLLCVSLTLLCVQHSSHSPC